MAPEPNTIPNTDDPGSPGQVVAPAQPAPGGPSAQMASQLGLQPQSAPQSAEQQQIAAMLASMQQQSASLEKSRQSTLARREQIWQRLQSEMRPDAIQNYLPKPSASGILNDLLLNFTRGGAAAQLGWGAPEPIQMTRLKNAMQFQRQNMQALGDQLSLTHQDESDILGQQNYARQLENMLGLQAYRSDRINQAERALDEKAMTDKAPFPDQFTDFYKGLPKAFTDAYPVAAPIKPANGIVTNAELRAITTQYQRDLAAYTNWQNRNQPITDLDIGQVMTKIHSLNLPPEREQRTIAQVGLAYGAPGTREDKVKAVNNAIQQAVNATERPATAVATEAGKLAVDAPTLNAKTTSTGHQYVDATGISGQRLVTLKKNAANAGIPVLSKEGNDAIDEIEQARLNQQMITEQLLPRLPKDAAGRITAGPSNLISQYIQSDSFLAAVGTYRIAAIQALRAAAGSRGLRINEAEIRQSVENDIPKVTDTVGVAQQKLANINRMLDGQESILMRPVAPVTSPANPSSIAPPPTPNQPPKSVSVKSPNGKTYTFRTQKDADAFKTAAGIR